MRSRRIRIKLISVFFALVAVGILSVMIAFIIQTKESMFPKNLSSQKKNFFSEVKFKTYNQQGKEINLKSDSIHESKKNNYVFKNMVSDLIMSSGETLKISSDVTNAIRKDKTQCEFIGNVKLSTKSGLLMKTAKLFADFDQKIAHGNTEIVISQDDTMVSAKKYFFDMNKNILILKDHANGYLKSNKINADRLVIRFDNMHEKNVQNMDAFGNITYTTKDYVLRVQKSILYSSNKIYARGNVILLHRKNGNLYDVRSDSMEAQINNGTLDNIKANHSLTIKTNNAMIRADKGILKGDKIKVIGNVEVSGKQRNILGSSGILDIKTGDIFISNSSGIVDDGICR